MLTSSKNTFTETSRKTFGQITRYCVPARVTHKISHIPDHELPSILTGLLQSCVPRVIQMPNDLFKYSINQQKKPNSYGSQIGNFSRDSLRKF